MSRLLKILMIVGAIIAALTAALMMHGCATTKAVVTACRPSTLDETQLVTDLFSSPTLTTAEVLALAEGSRISACVITQIAKDALAQVSTIQLSSDLGSKLPPLVANARAWAAAHP